MTFTSITNILVLAITNFIFLSILAFVFWMAVDASKGDKYWWVVLILGIPLIGALVYFFVEKKHEYFKLRRGE